MSQFLLVGLWFNPFEYAPKAFGRFLAPPGPDGRVYSALPDPGLDLTASVTEEGKGEKGGKETGEGRERGRRGGTGGGRREGREREKREKGGNGAEKKGRRNLAPTFISKKWAAMVGMSSVSDDDCS